MVCGQGEVGRTGGGNLEPSGSSVCPTYAKFELAPFPTTPEEVRMETLLRDVRYLVRSLRSSPAFFIVVILTIAVAVGSTTALFSVVDPLLLRAEPFADPAKLVALWESPPRADGVVAPGKNEVSPGTLGDWSAERSVFDGVAAIAPWRPNLTGIDEPTRLDATAVSRDFFKTLGARPLLGRVFVPEESTTGKNAVVVLSYTFWQQRFGGDSGVVGRELSLSGRPYTVVGVMPERFQLRYPLPQASDLWRPMVLEGATATNRQAHYLYVFGRLKRGVSPERAQSALSALAARRATDFPATNRGWGARVIPLREDIASDVRPLLLVGSAAVALVLLIACANVANLLLARGASRAREVALRTALGATRVALVRQLATESVALAIIGALIGLPLARALVAVFVRFGPPAFQSNTEIALNGRVIAFAVGLAVLTGVVFGLGPALFAARTSAADALREGARRVSSGRAGARTRDALVALEVALAAMLLIGAGLTLLSFSQLLRVDPGFNAHNAVTFELGLPAASYPTPERVTQAHHRLVEQLRSMPAVSEVGASSHVPLAGGNMTTGLEIEGRPVVPPERAAEVNYRVTTDGFTGAVGMTVKRGRAITAGDATGGWRVATISQTAADRLFRGEDPVGRRVRVTGDSAWLTIVGIIGDVRHASLESAPAVDVYIPIEREPSNFMRYVVRTTGTASSLAPDIRRAVRAFDPTVPIVGLETLESTVARASVPRRFAMLLLGSFAAIALVLAVGGVYAMVAYAVSQRMQELAVRVALGARPGEVVRTVMARGLGAVGVGLGAGVLLAFVLGRAMSALLYGVNAHDPMIYLAAPAVLGIVAVVSALLPALRASRVDPIVALRDA
jgi:putative ABC transport system permease protein